MLAGARSRLTAGVAAGVDSKLLIIGCPPGIRTPIR